jgi:thiamine pyrophosphate-dependent acetolactate synthase large subunit-like protein
MIGQEWFVSTLCATTASRRSLLVVGNGRLAREVAARAARFGNVIVLQGAMGMAASVALGYSEAAGTPVVVLEGDGNFLMGSPSSPWLQARRANVLHLVAINGRYATSGGQALPVCPTRVQRGTILSRASQLEEILASWWDSRDYLLAYVRLSEEARVSTRPAYSLAVSASQVIRRSRESQGSS